jgi:hypothetical protein
MTAETMQAAWKASTQKLEAFKSVNEELVKEIVSLRSQSISAAIKRRYRGLIGLLIFYIVVFSTILITNPFDYKMETPPLIPLAILTTIELSFLVATITAWRRMNRKSLDQMNMIQSLEQSINDHQKFRKFLECTFISTGILFSIAIKPDIIYTGNLEQAVKWIGICIVIPLAVVFVIYKLKIFNNTSGKQMKQALSEIKQRLQELKAPEDNILQEL